MKSSAFASNVRKRRKIAGLSLQELAARCGVSASMLSAVERGARSPTLRIATQIVEGLGASLTEVLGEQPSETPLVLRCAGQPVFVERDSGVQRRSLSPVLVRHGVETSWYRLPPRATAGPFRPHTHTMYEQVIVIRGRVVARLGGEDYALGRGDSLTYRGNVDHMFSNPGRSPAEYVHVALGSWNR